MRDKNHIFHFLFAAFVLALLNIWHRTLNVFFPYHAASLIIFICAACLGLGCVTAEFIRNKSKDRSVAAFTIWSAIFSGILCLGVGIFTGYIPNPYLHTQTSFQRVMVFMACGAAPFFFSGLSLGLSYSGSIKHPGFLLGDMALGSASGFLLSGILLSVLGGPAALIGISAIAFAASIFCGPSKISLKSLIPGSCGIILIAILIFFHLSASLFDMRTTYGEVRQTESNWNSFSQVSIADQPKNGKKIAIVDHAISIPLAIPPDVPETYLSRLPFLLFERPRVLMLGISGLSAMGYLKEESFDLTVIEPNPLLANALRKTSSLVSALMFNKRGFQLKETGIRSFAARQKKAYDIIIFSDIRRWAYEGSSFASISQTPLTLEAIVSLLEALNPNGMLVFFCNDASDNYIKPFIYLVKEALMDVGIKPENFSERFFVGTIKSTIVLFISMKPFDLETIHKTESLANKLNASIQFTPFKIGFGEYYQLARSMAISNYPISQNPGFYISDDDWPFFFFPTKAGSVNVKWQNSDLETGINLRVVSLFIVVILLIGIGIVVFILPFLQLESRPIEFWPNIMNGFFAAFIGLGSTWLLTGISNRFLLFIDSNTWGALSYWPAVFFAIGIGSFIFDLVAPKIKQPDRLVRALVLALLFYVAGMLAIFNSNFTGWWVQPIGIRILTTFLLLLPLGLIMGLLLPFMTEKKDEINLTSWLLGIFFVFSGIGIASSNLLALKGGFLVVTVVGLLCLIVSLFLYKRDLE